MPQPLHLKRDKKRKPEKVKKDIERTHKILRQDVYDVLKTARKLGKTKEHAISDLRIFLSTLKSKAIEYQGDRNKGIERVISDVNSYGIKWKKLST